MLRGLRVLFRLAVSHLMELSWPVGGRQLGTCFGAWSLLFLFVVFGQPDSAISLRIATCHRTLTRLERKKTL